MSTQFWALSALILFTSHRECSALSPKYPNKIKNIDYNNIQTTLSRRATLKNILLGAAITTTTPAASNAASDEGIPTITDSSIGRSFRKSAIKGARVIDNLDEKWERFSDSLRDGNKCDENTGRRLYDNGFRKDGTRIGNPVLGDLCEPVSLLPLNPEVAERVLEGGVTSAAALAGAGDTAAVRKSVREVEELVRASFERSVRNVSDEEERKRKLFNFSLYSQMRAISNDCTKNGGATCVRRFQSAWGSELVAQLAPMADRRDYSSPFPEVKDEFEDYDYDKGKLLDALGAVKVSLDKLKSAGLVGYSEISVPYDNYGSVVTVAIDDYVPIGAEMLLAEQGYGIAGPAQALIRSVMDKARIDYNLDTYYIDPSTTKQNEYNPSQLLLSLNNLRKM